MPKYDDLPRCADCDAFIDRCSAFVVLDGMSRRGMPSPASDLCQECFDNRERKRAGRNKTSTTVQQTGADQSFMDMIRRKLGEKESEAQRVERESVAQEEKSYPVKGTVDDPESK